MDFLISPLINALLVFYRLLGNSFPLALVVLTVLLRVVTLPLTLPQQRQTRRMSELQPQLKELQKKYGNNREKMTQEQMKLYREHGVNPLGGCLPLILQLFIMIAFYQAITGALALNPLQLMALSQRVGPDIAALLPIESHFLWLDLGQPDPFFVLPVLVVATTYLQQRVMTPASADPSQASMSRQMNIMMPLMFGLFALQFASGLSIYFIVSNVIGIAQFALIGRKSTSAPASAGGKPESAVKGTKAVVKK
jgi:YidC/Oxa1 family membrane protein insertase